MIGKGELLTKSKKKYPRSVKHNPGKLLNKSDQDKLIELLCECYSVPQMTAAIKCNPASIYRTLDEVPEFAERWDRIRRHHTIAVENAIFELATGRAKEVTYLTAFDTARMPLHRFPDGSIKHDPTYTMPEVQYMAKVVYKAPDSKAIEKFLQIWGAEKHNTQHFAVSVYNEDSDSETVTNAFITRFRELNDPNTITVSGHPLSDSPSNPESDTNPIEPAREGHQIG